MKILINHSSVNDACAFYRSTGPWSRIQRLKSIGFKVVIATNPTLEEVISSDIFFVSRPCLPETRRAAQAAKGFGVRIWSDYDDDLLSVPSCNPNFSFYARSDVRANIEWFIQESHVVSVSTEVLGDKLRKIRGCPDRELTGVRVLPNAIPDNFLDGRKFVPQRKVILWRGSATHNRDVASVASQLVEIAAKHTEWSFAFVGADPVPYQCSEKMDRVIRYPAMMDPVVYFELISTLSPMVMIAPLADVEFNRSKSNIAALEAAYCGAVCVGRDWEEWRQVSIGYESEERFSLSLEQAMADNSIAAKHWAWVEKNRLLSTINDKRIAITRGLSLG